MTTALKTAEKPKAEPEKLPVEVDPKRVMVDVAGFAWRTVLVRMPMDATQDLLRDPKIWKRVQSNVQTSLRERDHLFILAFDESWYARAIVAHSSATEAHLVIEKVGAYREMGSSFYSDGEREVFWDGGAYGVRRRSDGVRVLNEGYTTEAGPIAALHASYPKKAG